MADKIVKKYQALFARSEKRLAKAVSAKAIHIQVGSATCENAAGARELWKEFENHIQASGRKDIKLHATGCTGRCSREPIVGILAPGQIPVKYEQVDRAMAHDIFSQHVLQGKPLHEKMLEALPTNLKHQVVVCERQGAERTQEGGVHTWFAEKIEAAGFEEGEVPVFSVNYMGFKGSDPKAGEFRILVRPANVLYKVRSPKDVDKIIKTHLKGGDIVDALRVDDEPITKGFVDLYSDVSFFRRQSRVALRKAGLVDPESIDEYMHYRGFAALTQVLQQDDPDALIQDIIQANLRGRGGGGFSTGVKWSFARKNTEKERFIICNADEGDPGAFMDRSMLESDPFGIVEGMIIGGYATGAQHGFFYVRAEYPLAIRRIQHAIDTCREHGFLGKKILGSNFSFDLEIRLGAGAFVCGEETALIKSIEGERGQPTIRPPFPTDEGLWGKPTVINNVETYANITAIINYGSEWFRDIGINGSGGTKVFALAGKVRHTGLIEVPIGTKLRDVVYGIGGGVPGGKALKAVQTGGPAGGLIPYQHLDTPVDFDTLAKMGSIMGSGGMIVLDEDDCIVDMAKFFMTFCQDESCGKCTPCREGTKRMLEILERITQGKGALEDIGQLERLAKLVQRSSLCGLGRAAPNPVLSSLKHYRDEYIAHVVDRTCPAKKCTQLITYEIDAEKCVGCNICARKCPATCITGARKTPHVIDQDHCVKCGQCFEHCRFDAILKS
jgi:NADH:ubiquinone oxidoreductase subunit F (NADH-binding)/(2Fe-2S) ferredoxin/NAD-dependent dihydropyrimidine dehydrogenase PreA subunit